MAWHVRYLTKVGQSLAGLDHRYPYLFGVLSSAAITESSIAQRIRNYLHALSAEQARARYVEHLPYHLVVDPCDVCSLKCPLCVQTTDPNGRHRRFISSEHVEQIASELQNELLRVDLFSWGEPLLHPQFSAIVKSFSLRNVYTRTSTHLSLTRNFDPEMIVGSGLRYLVASIDGATQSVYEQYRRGGQIDVVLRNAEALATARERARTPFPILDWQFLAFQHNQHEIEGAAALARNVGFDVYRYGGARGNLADRIREKSAENYSRSSKLLLPGDHPLSEYTQQGMLKNPAEYEGCRWLWGKLAIHADGGMAPCWTAWRKEHDFGNLNEVAVSKLWQAQIYRNAREIAVGVGDYSLPLVCSACTQNRAFTNAPDAGDAEISHRVIFEIVDVLEMLGTCCSKAAVQAAELEISAGLKRLYSQQSSIRDSKLGRAPSVSKLEVDD